MSFRLFFFPLRTLRLCVRATARLCADEIFFWRVKKENFISAEPHKCAERRGAEYAEKEGRGKKNGIKRGLAPTVYSGRALTVMYKENIFGNAKR
jgi:hypothetical protein